VESPGGTMTRRLGTRNAIAAIAAIALVGAMAIPAGASSGASRRRAQGGGTITVGAEQEPDCADWISSCAGASWGEWTMQEHSMPRVFVVAK